MMMKLITIGRDKMEIMREIEEDYKIAKSEDCLKYIEGIRNLDREHFVVLGLDTQNKVTYREIAHIGTLNSCIIHPREIFKKAILMGCHSIITVHNHPAGSIEPSEEDKMLSNNIRDAGEILGIKLLDSLIITKNKLESYIQPKMTFD